MNKNIVLFYGVPLVRVIKVDRLWQVQLRDSETSDDWQCIGNPYKTREQAVEAAPYLCEF